MSSGLLATRLRQAVQLELRSWRTPGCGLPYALRKWVAVARDTRHIRYLGEDIEYEDRFDPFMIFNYVNEVGATLEWCAPRGRTFRVLEVGANVGLWGRTLLRLVPDADLYSFEPNPAPFAILERNRGARRRWRTFNVGVGPREEELPFYWVPGKSGQGSVYEANATQSLMRGGRPMRSTVAIRPLPAAFLDRECGGRHFDLVKIDVEGAERDVIAGLGDITWETMYVELSTDREGAATVESFTALLRRRWPAAHPVSVHPLGEFAEVHYSTRAPG